MHTRQTIRHQESERGSVTTEFAVALPAVVLVLLLVVSVALAGAARVALEDAARAAARELARGASAETAQQTVVSTAGADAEVHITQQGAYTHVRLTQPVSILGLVETGAEHTAEAQVRTEHAGGMP
ncbi:TadE family type IV pilus minor pilin [Nesterenkonia sp.]|uniref:TadE family type IV pilus minor pilin n=1 Tax=Nesterenkonia sp. TaxID=704201 RepID=UPI0026198F7E|nr:TadE family type IV pilus minor pilin [Nesterenkonia sp.]